MKTSWNPLVFAGAVAVLTLGLVFGGGVPTSAQPDKKGDPGALRPFQKELCVENGTAVTHSFIPVAIGPTDTSLFARATRLYADPGTPLVFAAGVNFTATSSCEMTLSGHLAVE